jgi:2-phospho-L-lactate transferase/gluconeogenesis factor (CofD/UPF0052 family)
VTLRVVAFGGGHGLSASLRGLRRCARELDLEITAIVTVGDDGGSSGRLRAERDALIPPGDLRQALAALAADEPYEQRTAELLQHRFAAMQAVETADGLAGHPVGNLLLLGLMEMLGDPVAALDHAAKMVGAQGRILPMARRKIDIVADMLGGDPARPDDVVTVRGQHNVAVAHGHVAALRIEPADPPTCDEAISVLPHLLVPGLAAAISASPARRLVTLNLAADNETHGLSVADHLAALHWYRPGLRVDTVLADAKWVGEPEPVHQAAESLGAQLVLAPLAVADGSPRHDPESLGVALVPVLGAAR